jgi:hypothetical protein
MFAEGELRGPRRSRKSKLDWCILPDRPRWSSIESVRRRIASGITGLALALRLHFLLTQDLDAIRPELTRSGREGLKVYYDREVS